MSGKGEQAARLTAQAYPVAYPAKMINLYKSLSTFEISGGEGEDSKRARSGLLS